ncbi:MAG: hypothetical protein IJ493_00620 [Clostridia bacterium]|nr:hypothetical protein [Clostridia bacterium]
MRYRNLHELVQRSGSSRRYFLSLPVEDQLAMQEYGESIHTAAELRRCVEGMAAMRRQDALGGWR